MQCPFHHNSLFQSHVKYSSITAIGPHSAEPRAAQRHQRRSNGKARISSPLRAVHLIDSGYCCRCRSNVGCFAVLLSLLSSIPRIGLNFFRPAPDSELSLGPHSQTSAHQPHMYPPASPSALSPFRMGLEPRAKWELGEAAREKTCPVALPEK
jgi:hypothetical protein